MKNKDEKFGENPNIFFKNNDSGCATGVIE